MSEAERRAELSARWERLTPEQRERLAELRRGAGARASRGDAAATFGLDAAPKEGPLTWTEEGIFRRERAEGALGYVTPIAARLRGALDQDALARALSQLVARHDALRSCFVERDGTPWRIVEEPSPMALRRHVLRGDEGGLASFLGGLAAEPFDLARGPLVRADLVDLGPNDAALLVSFHHLVVDGPSLETLSADLHALYSAAKKGVSAQLGTAPSFAALAPVLRGAEPPREALVAAAEELREVRSWPRIHLDEGQAAEGGPRGARLPIVVPRALWGAISGLARRLGATPYSVLCSMFAAVLGGVGGRDRVALAAPFVTRAAAGSEAAVGLLVDTAILPIRLDIAATAAELIEQTSRAVRRVLSRTHVPLERLVSLSAGAAGRDAPFDAMVVLNDATSAHLALEGVSAEAIEVDPGGALFDLLLVVWRRDDELFGYLEHRLARVSHGAARGIAELWMRCLERVAREPSRALEGLLSADVAGGALMLVGPPACHDTSALVHHGLFASDAKPDAIVVRDDGGQLSRRAAAARVERAAAGLFQAGIRPLDRVAVALDRGADLVVALHAVLAAGASYVPVDVGLPDARTLAILDDARPKLVIADARIGARFGAGAAVMTLASLEAIGGPPLADAISPSDPAYIIHTSGSTGRPKGVVVPHGAVTQLIDSMGRLLPIGQEDRWLALTSIGFDIAALEIFGPIRGGAEIVMAPRQALHDPALLAELLRDATIAQTTPSVWRALVASGWRGERDLKLLCGGEPLARDLADALLSRAREVINLYGPTETTIWSTLGRVTHGEGRVPVGEPIHGTKILIAGPSGAPLARGCMGEVWIGGAGVAIGYHDREDLTAERFVTRGGERFYRTGDRGRARWDSQIDVVGRNDRQLKVRGTRVEPGEIEAVLRGVPGVIDAAVVPLETPEETELVAWLAADRAERASAEEVLSHWRSIWEAVWSGPRAAEGLDLRGWVSPETGKPFEARTFEPWIEYALCSIRERAPEKVLEIGCGGGDLLRRMAPFCSVYDAMDVSEVAVTAAQEVCSREAGLGHVRLAVGETPGATTFGGERYDVIVVGSVVQYLPDLAHLEAFIGACLARLTDRGALYLGDVRLLAGLLFRAQNKGGRDTAHDRDRWAHALIDAEMELLVDPGWLAETARSHGYIAEIRVGRPGPRELGDRVDVWFLRAGASGAIETIRHVQAGCLAQDLERVVSDGAPFLVADLLDVRWQDVDAEAASAGPFAVLAGGDVAAHPEGAIAVFRCKGLGARALWPASGRAGRFDLLVLDASDGRAFETAKTKGEICATDPRHALGRVALVDVARAEAQAHLPSALVPSRWGVVRELPRLSSGKTDLAALFALVPGRVAERPFVAPSTSAERAIASIFGALLGVARVSAEDDFFALGGHSLLAAQAMTRLWEALGVRLPLAAMFASPTVRGLAQKVEAAGKGAVGSGAAPAGNTSVSPRETRVSRTNEPAEPGVYTASFGQARLFFLDAAAPGASVSIPVALRIFGTLDRAAIERALTRIMARHASLRTTFASSRGRVEARVGAAMPVEVEEISTAEPVEEEAAALARRPFDLTKGPLFRPSLVRGPNGDLLLLDLHHTVADGISCDILVRELGLVLAGREATLPTLSTTAADQAKAERVAATSAEGRARASALAEQLRDAPPISTLPLDRPRPKAPDGRGSIVPIHIARELTAGASALARRLGVTPFSVVLGAYALTLSRLAQQDEMCFGVPHAGRDNPASEGVIGMLVRTLVMRVTAPEKASFAEVCRSAHRALSVAMEHAEAPFDEVVRLLGKNRTLSCHPVFQTFVAVQPGPLPSFREGGFSLVAEAIHPGKSPFDLTLLLWERDGGYQGWIEHATELFDTASIEAFAKRMVAVLSRGVRSPEAPIFAADLRLSGEPCAIVGPSMQPAVDVWERFVAQARRTPMASALSDVGQEPRSYAEVEIQARKLASALRACGVGPGDRVGLALSASADCAVAMLACLARGAAFVPIDPDGPSPRRALVEADASLALVLEQRSAPERPRSATVEELLAAKGASNNNGLSTDESVGQFRQRIPVNSIAYILFTSGSTGRPKGVEIERSALASCFAALDTILRLTGPCRWLAVTAPTFDIAVLEHLYPLLCGAHITFVPPADAADGERLLALVRSIDPDWMQTTPSRFRLLVAAGLERSERLSLLCGGEALAADLAESLAARCRRLVDVYGPTEATIWCTAGDVCPGERARTVGRPFAASAAWALDTRGYPLPKGAIGELGISGPQLARGYLHAPELTADRFVFLPEGGERVYRTGDRARLRHDGTIEVLGRIDTQTKIRGLRIEMGEIEAVLASHPAVAEAAVTVLAEGRGEARLAAHVVVDPRWPGPQEAFDRDHTEARAEAWRVLHREAKARGQDLAAALVWGSGAQPDRSVIEAWASTVAATATALRPRAVLELGGGSGLVAERCLGAGARIAGASAGGDGAAVIERWISVDHARDAVLAWRGRLADRPGAEAWELTAQEALAKVVRSGDHFDLVLIDGVADDLPGATALGALLAGAARCLTQDGSVLIAGLLDASLLAAVEAAAALSAAAPSDDVAALRERVAQKLAEEPSLAVSVAELLHVVQAEAASPDARLVLAEVTPVAGAHPGGRTETRSLVRLRRPYSAPFAASVDKQHPFRIPLADRWRAPDNSPPSEGPFPALAQAAARPAEGATATFLDARLIAARAAETALAQAPAHATVAELRSRAARLARSMSETAVVPLDVVERANALRVPAKLHRAASDPFVLEAAFGAESSADRGLGALEATGARLATHPARAGFASRYAPRLREHLRAHLPEQMVPSILRRAASLPRLSGGKLDRTALARLAPPSPLESRPVRAPRTPMESTLVALVAEVLRLDAVDPDASFFDLGGASLTSLELATVARAAGIRLTPAMIFSHPVLSDLAQEIA